MIVAKPSPSPRALRGARATVAVVLSALALSACAEAGRGKDHPADSLHFPAALAADPDGRHLYVVNTNFDLAYRGGSIAVVDLMTNELVRNAAIQVGTFPGKLVLDTNDQGVATAGYLPDRDANAVSWFTIERNKDGVPNLRCSEAPPADGIESCDAKHIVEQGTINGSDVFVGDNPFGAGILKLGANQADLLFSGALIDGRLSMFRLGEDGTPTLVRAIQLQAGLHGIAASAATGFTYVSTHFAPQIFALRVTDVALDGAVTEPTLDAGGNPMEPIPQVALGSIPVTNVSTLSDYGHGLVVNREGTRAYVAYRSPASVLVLDISPGADGVPSNRVLDLVAVGRRPTELAVTPRKDGAGDLIYVVCFADNNVYVVDTVLMDVIDVIPTGIGPYDIAIVDSDTVGRRAYVSLFEEHAVAVIELDPTSAYYHQIISEIR